MARHCSIALLSLLSFVGASRAAAQQPLSAFLEGLENSDEVREALATAALADSQVAEVRGRVLPSLVAQGSYTRNQYAAEFNNPLTMTTITIQPHDSLQASFVVNVPLIDIAGWYAVRQAAARSDAAVAQAELARANVEIAVAQAWHGLVLARGVARAAVQTRDAIAQNLAAVNARVEVGVSPAIDAARAEAELARADQALLEANFQVALSERALKDLTGVEPNQDEAALNISTSEELPLEQFLSRLEEHPLSRASQANADAASIGRNSAFTLFLPTVTGSFRETGSNAAGFTGQNWSWAAGVTATWVLDGTRVAAVRQRRAADEIAAAQSARAVESLRTQVFEAWHRVQTSRQSVVSAERLVQASERAATDARARFEIGAGTQLESISADRDLFAARVSELQAKIGYRLARLALRLRSGWSASAALAAIDS